MVEIIRSTTRNTPQKVWEFGLEFRRGKEFVVHEFKAYPAMDAGGLSYTLSATHKPERAIEDVVRSIRTMLADDDGTPADYRPTRYDPTAAEPPEGEDDTVYQERHAAEPTNDDLMRNARDEMIVKRAEPAIENLPPGWRVAERPELDEEEDSDSLFAGPDGEPATGEQVVEALKFENGSSRRRFSYLMDEDESLTLDIGQLQTTYKKLLAQVAGRPTRR